MVQSILRGSAQGQRLRPVGLTGCTHVRPVLITSGVIFLAVAWKDYQLKRVVPA